MAFVKKTWKDRIAEFATRRLLTKADGSTELVSVSREEGEISEEGDAFSAENMNNLEERIEQEFANVNNSLVGFPDVTNVIATIQNNIEYTATENCWIIGKANGTSGIGITYDGVALGSYTSNAEHVLMYPLKKGHTIKIYIAGTVTVNSIKAYGFL